LLINARGPLCGRLDCISSTALKSRSCWLVAVGPWNDTCIKYLDRDICLIEWVHQGYPSNARTSIMCPTRRSGQRARAAMLGHSKVAWTAITDQSLLGDCEQRLPIKARGSDWGGRIEKGHTIDCSGHNCSGHIQTWKRLYVSDHLRNRPTDRDPSVGCP
jgi:hypothetical protein